MKRMKWSLFILFLIGLGNASGQDISLSISAPKVVALGENFRLTFTANAQPDKFNPPELNGIMILGGPSTSSQSSASFINGKMTSENYKTTSNHSSSL